MLRLVLSALVIIAWAWLPRATSAAFAKVRSRRHARRILPAWSRPRRYVAAGLAGVFLTAVFPTLAQAAVSQIQYTINAGTFLYGNLGNGFSIGGGTLTLTPAAPVTAISTPAFASSWGFSFYFTNVMPTGIAPPLPNGPTLTWVGNTAGGLTLTSVTPLLVANGAPFTHLAIPGTRLVPDSILNNGVPLFLPTIVPWMSGGFFIQAPGGFGSAAVGQGGGLGQINGGATFASNAWAAVAIGNEVRVPEPGGFPFLTMGGVLLAAWGWRRLRA